MKLTHCSHVMTQFSAKAFTSISACFEFDSFDMFPKNFIAWIFGSGRFISKWRKKQNASKKANHTEIVFSSVLSDVMRAYTKRDNFSRKKHKKNKKIMIKTFSFEEKEDKWTNKNSHSNSKIANQYCI